MDIDRRQAARVPVGFYLSQLVDDQPYRCFTTSLSTAGLYMERPLSVIERRRGTVQVELPLPGTSDSLWARAQVVYDCFDALFHGTAVRFTAMAHRHRRLLREWLHEQMSAIGEGQVVHADAGVSIFRPPPVRR